MLKVWEQDQVHVLESQERWVDVLARDFLKQTLTLKEGKRFTVALSGGSTPAFFYKRLTQEPYDSSIPWERISFFFGDERSVSAEHVDSNYRMAMDSFLKGRSSRVFRMKAEQSDVLAYRADLENELELGKDGVPCFDLILLGIGEDGHTASLFPETSALNEMAEWVVMNDVPQLQTKRMTFTYPLLNAAKQVWILIQGEKKQGILKDCLLAKRTEENVAKWPILGVSSKSHQVFWWLEASAVDESLKKALK